MAQRNKRRLDRKVNSRPFRDRFLIVCEGEKTEPQYFRGFRVSTTVKIVGIGGNTSTVVEAAEEEFRNGDYDQVWCVFDKDSFSAQNFNTAIQMAEAKGYRVAYSNEAFELWYVLHFCFHQSAVSRARYKPILKRYLNKPYKKNQRHLFDELRPMQRTAIRNAEKLLEMHSPCNPASDNPSTTVHLLVLELLRFVV